MASYFWKMVGYLGMKNYELNIGSGMSTNPILMAISCLYKQAGRSCIIATMNAMQYYAFMFVIGCKLEEKLIKVSINNDCI